MMFYVVALRRRQFRWWASLQPGVQTTCSHLFVLLLQAYYGGEAVCAEAASDDYDPKELVCGGCSDVTAAQVSFGCE